MTTYADRAAIAADPTFKSRVNVALMTAAIMNGLQPQQSDESDIVYKRRVAFSLEVMFESPADYLNAFTNGLAWNSDLVPGQVNIAAAAADITPVGDAMIQAAVNAVFEFRVKVWWV